MSETLEHDESQSLYGPVTDWQTDFDHADPDYNLHAHEIWSELREQCPVAHSDRYGGAWLPVTHADVTRIAYDTDNFTSRAVVVNTGEVLAEAPIGNAPPISSDPPFHHHARRLLLPPFAPKQIDPWEDDVRSLCNELIDEMGDGELIDAAVQYAQNIPVNVIARMLGFPLEDADLFRGFVHEVLEGVNQAPAVRQAAFERLDAYLDAQIQDHVDHPRDDLTNFLMHATIFDQPLSHEHVRGSIVLLLLAGIDTTWSAIGSSLWHLASDAVRPRTARCRSRAVAHGDRGVPPGVRAGHDGAPGGPGPRLQRVPDEEGRLGAAAVPGGQPRPDRVRARRRGADRS